MFLDVRKIQIQINDNFVSLSIFFKSINVKNEQKQMLPELYIYLFSIEITKNVYPLKIVFLRLKDCDNSQNYKKNRKKNISLTNLSTNHTHPILNIRNLLKHRINKIKQTKIDMNTINRSRVL